jgi:hypothetical protein
VFFACCGFTVQANDFSSTGLEQQGGLLVSKVVCQ